MKFETQKSFDKTVLKVRDEKLKKALSETILSIHNAQRLSDIKGIKLFGKKYCRIRVMNTYRIGAELLNDGTLSLVVFAARKDIYKIFP